jgi:putative redox protein
MPTTTVVRSSEDALLTEAVAGGRWTIVADEPEALGGTDAAPTPYQLLTASLATCVAITVRMYARRKGWEVGPFTVEVCLDDDDRPHGCSVDVRLPPGLDPERAERLRHIAKRCPVHRTLAEGLAFEPPATVVS